MATAAWEQMLTMVRAAFWLLILRLGREEEDDDDDEEGVSRFLLGCTLGPAEADAGGRFRWGGGTVGVGVVERTSALAGGVESSRTAAGSALVEALGAWATRTLEWRRAEKDMGGRGWAVVVRCASVADAVVASIYVCMCRRQRVGEAVSGAGVL